MSLAPSCKLEDLKDRIAGKGRLLVAYSGGVDSSLLAKVANDVLGESALAVILDSVTLARSELEQSRELAKSLGLNFRVAKFSILTDDEFAKILPQGATSAKKSPLPFLRTSPGRMA